MAKLRLSYLEKELCGLTPVPVDTLSEDELGAKSALPKKGFIPIEEISEEQVLEISVGPFSTEQVQACTDPLDSLSRNMRLV